MSGGLDEVIAAAEILLVGQNREGGGTVLLIRERDDVGLSVFLDPAFRGRLALELCGCQSRRLSGLATSRLR
jgi:hypothetical protein